MPQLGKYIRAYTDKVTQRTGHGFWCPCCQHMHYISTDDGPHPVWTFDGNIEEPSFSPSLRTFIHERPAMDGQVKRPERTLCHLWVKKGQIEFYGDSSGHELRGFVPMVDLGEILNYNWGYE